MIIKAVLDRASVVALFVATVCLSALTVEAAAEEGFGPFIKLDAGEELL
ncbi:MAG: hypothetical protein ACR2RE_11350 [Geminicoccaceae bacterium]